jgi:hypothetical protein
MRNKIKHQWLVQNSKKNAYYLILLFICFFFINCRNAIELNKTNYKIYSYSQLPKKIQELIIDSINIINNDGFDYIMNLDKYSVKIETQGGNYINEILFDDNIYINNNLKFKFKSYGEPYIFSDTIMYIPIKIYGEYDTTMIKQCKFCTYNLSRYLRN